METTSAFERGRFRRALIASLAQGEAYALTIHDRMRERGFTRDDVSRVFAELRVLETEGIAVSKPSPADVRLNIQRPRRVFGLTRRGVDELARAGHP